MTRQSRRQAMVFRRRSAALPTSQSSFGEEGCGGLSLAVPKQLCAAKSYEQLPCYFAVCHMLQQHPRLSSNGGEDSTGREPLFHG